LTEILENGDKVYAAVFDSNLTEIETNDLEYKMIAADKQGKSV
jgi:hypothetical protein